MTEYELDTFSALVTDFASELDLHYEVDASEALLPSLRNLEAGARVLRNHNRAIPDACQHTMLRLGVSANS